MLPRPSTFGSTVEVKTVDDVDAALHEMAWLTAKETSISDAAGVRMAAIQTEAKAKAIVTIDEKPLTIKERWKALYDAVFAWCDKSLRASLKANKRSLTLPHGAIKLRALPAAVALLNGKTAEAVALGLAQNHGLLAATDKLLKKSIEITDGDGNPIEDVAGIALNDLVSVQFVLNKEAVKERWAKRPEIHAFLRSLSISVEAGQEQITIAPAALPAMTPEAD